MMAALINKQRCTKCRTWFPRNLRLCPVCGEEHIDRSAVDLCRVCGANLTAGQSACPYCGSVRRGSLARLLPLLGRGLLSLLILGLGAALIWWIIPFAPLATTVDTAQDIGAVTATVAENLGTEEGDLQAQAPAVRTPAVQTPAVQTPASQALVAPEPTAEATATVTEAATLEPTAESESALVEDPTPEPDAPAGESTGEPAEVEANPTGRTHTVASGDVIGRIAIQYAVPLSDLLQANSLSEMSILRIGQVLTIPDSAPAPTADATEDPPEAPAAPAFTTTTLVHTVSQGDTLGAIAVRYRVNSDVIARENGLSLNAVLRLGQQLIIPGASVPATPEPTPEPTVAPTGTPVPAATPTVRPTVTPTTRLRAAGASLTSPLELLPGVTPPTPAPRTNTPTPTPEPTATPTIEPTPEPTATPTLRVHVVQPGEHIGVVADTYGFTMAQIAQANDMAVSDYIQVGQELVIPPAPGEVAPPPPEPTPTEPPTPEPTQPPATEPAPAASPPAETPQPEATEAPPVVPAEPVRHTVQQGDTLMGVAVHYQVSSAEIASANNISLNTVLSIGQELVIPGTTAEPTAEPAQTAVAAAESTPTPEPTEGTPTPFPQRTRPVTRVYRQPRPLTPINGTVFTDTATLPVLQWTSVGILQGDEWYEVRLWTPTSGTEPEVYRTRATSWRLPGDFHPDARRGDRFSWDVTAVRLLGTAPGSEALSPTSVKRSFRWQ